MSYRQLARMPPTTRSAHLFLGIGITLTLQRNCSTACFALCAYADNEAKKTAVLKMLRRCNGFIGVSFFFETRPARNKFRPVLPCAPISVQSDGLVLLL